MHELSIIQNLFEILEEKAQEKKAKKIIKVRLQVGSLSGVVAELLQTAFDIYKKDTVASGAHLDIEKIPLQVECRQCGKRILKDDFIFVCSHCQSSDLKIISGTELIVEKIEMEI